MQEIQNLEKLGVGIGFRPHFCVELFLNRDAVDFLEITADHYLDPTREKLQELQLLKTHFPLIPHALDLSLGSAEGIDEIYLEKLAALINEIQPEWWSEHICFTKSGGGNLGHLAPIPYTNEALNVLVKNIKHVQSKIKVPLILENITHGFRYRHNEMSETQFISRICKEIDCGLLLDVTNLYINSHNQGYSWKKYLDQIPVEKIVQLHFVGGNLRGEVFIDTHSENTQSEIWEVFEEICYRTNIKGAILERDDKFPPFESLIGELAQARSIINSVE